MSNEIAGVTTVRSAPKPAEPANAETEDALVRAARLLLYVGLAFSSLMTLRITGFTLGDIALVCSALLLLISGPRRGGASRPILLATWIASGLVLAGGLLATLRADSLAGNTLTILRILFVMAVLPWQFRRLAGTEATYVRATWSWLAGAALCTLATLGQYKSILIPGASITQAGRYTGFTQHVSDVGGIGAATGACLLAWALNAKTGGLRLVALGGLASAGVGILLSGSVSAMLSIVVASVYLVLRGNASVGRLLLAVGVGAAVFGLAGKVQNSTNNALNPIERIRQVLGATDTERASLNTSATRLRYDQIGLDGFIHHPIIGRGLDESSTAVDIYTRDGPHNLFIGALYAGGILLFLGITIVVGQALVRAVRISRYDRLGTQAGSAFIAAFTFAMTAPSSFNRYFWIPLALVVSRPRSASDSHRSEK